MRMARAILLGILWTSLLSPAQGSLDIVVQKTATVGVPATVTWSRTNGDTQSIRLRPSPIGVDVYPIVEVPFLEGTTGTYPVTFEDTGIHEVEVEDMNTGEWVASSEHITVINAVVSNSASSSSTAQQGTSTLFSSITPSDPEQTVITAGANSTSDNSTSASSSTPVGAIVGGTVGGIFAVILTLLAIWLCRRRLSREPIHHVEPWTSQTQSIPSPATPASQGSALPRHLMEKNSTAFQARPSRFSELMVSPLPRNDPGLSPDTVTTPASTTQSLRASTVQSLQSTAQPADNLLAEQLRRYRERVRELESSNTRAQEEIDRLERERRDLADQLGSEWESVEPPPNYTR